MNSNLKIINFAQARAARQEDVKCCDACGDAVSGSRFLEYCDHLCEGCIESVLAGEVKNWELGLSLIAHAAIHNSEQRRSVQQATSEIFRFCISCKESKDLNAFISPDSFWCRECCDTNEKKDALMKRLKKTGRNYNKLVSYLRSKGGTEYNVDKMMDICESDMSFAEMKKACDATFWEG